MGQIKQYVLFFRVSKGTLEASDITQRVMAKRKQCFAKIHVRTNPRVSHKLKIRPGITNRHECAHGRTKLETIAFSNFRLFRFTIKRKVLHLQSSLGVR